MTKKLSDKTISALKSCAIIFGIFGIVDLIRLVIDAAGGILYKSAEEAVRNTEGLGDIDPTTLTNVSFGVVIGCGILVVLIQLLIAWRITKVYNAENRGSGLKAISIILIILSAIGLIGAITSVSKLNVTAAISAILDPVITGGLSIYLIKSISDANAERK